MSLNQIIGENIGFVIIIILLLLIGAILLGILALTKKSKSSPPQPLNSKEFKNNYCRSINNPSYAGANWIPGKCVAGSCNSALCDPDDKNCKYMDLCNAYGSENGQSDEIGSCCGMAENARMLEKNQDFQNYYCRSTNHNAKDNTPMKPGEYAYWVQKQENCGTDYTTAKKGYMNDGTCCIPNKGVPSPTPKT